LVSRRRVHYENKEWQKYEDVVMEMTQKEEQFVQTKLMDVISKLGISEQEFMKSSQYHGQD